MSSNDMNPMRREPIDNSQTAIGRLGDIWRRNGKRIKWFAAIVAMFIAAKWGMEFWNSAHEFVTGFAAPANTNQHKPDQIEGTQYTRKRLEDIFPFGYATFFYGQNKILRYEIHKTGLMEWKIDVDQVAISPDFFKSWVSWKIPNVTTTNINIQFKGGSITTGCPLKIGCIRRTGFLVLNQPVPHVITLSDNQRTPVFAIGYRMPLDGEGRPPGPPHFFITP